MVGRQNWQEGRETKYDMATFHEVLVKLSEGFMDKAKEAGKPFFIWHNTARMHVLTYLPPKYQALMNAKSNYNMEDGRRLNGNGRIALGLAGASQFTLIF